MIDPDFAVGGAREVLPTANYYFMFVSTFLITAVGTLVTVFVVEPRLGGYDSSRARGGRRGSSTKGMGRLSSLEWRGLAYALSTVLVLLVGLLFAGRPRQRLVPRPRREPDPGAGPAPDAEERRGAGSSSSSSSPAWSTAGRSGR